MSGIDGLKPVIEEDSSAEKSDTVFEISRTPEEERRARRKIDFTVLPLLTVGLFVFQLDRMNLSSALTSGLKDDIHLQQSDINLGNFLMYLGIIILEIPSNMLLVRFGPQVLIPMQVLCFGLVATLQSQMVGKGGFLATRLILGLCEAGYIPGSLFILSTWYKGDELARRISLLFCGMFGGFAFGPLIASGIVCLHGDRGIAGWKWIFIIEGVFTIFISLVLMALLPHSPYHVKKTYWIQLCSLFRPRCTYREGARSRKWHQARFTYFVPYNGKNHSVLEALATLPGNCSSLWYLESLHHVHAYHLHYA